jgi:ribosomal protein S18 acetylase RimI-like enzyme
VNALVRVAGPEDAEAVARLLAEFRTESFDSNEPRDDAMLASVRRLLDDPDTEYLVGGNGPDGVVQLRYRHSVWTGADDCTLEDLFVRAQARRSGLGSALVEAALARARERGCRRMELDTQNGNGAAIALYRRHGFAPERLQMRRRL